MEKRQRYTVELKREAVRLLKMADKPAAVLARELGVPRTKLHQWVLEADRMGEQAFPGRRIGVRVELPAFLGQGLTSELAAGGQPGG
jgi:transposase-like protein